MLKKITRLNRNWIYTRDPFYVYFVEDNAWKSLFFTAPCLF